jgi:hypothetical protein
VHLGYRTSGECRGLVDLELEADGLEPEHHAVVRGSWLRRMESGVQTTAKSLVSVWREERSVRSQTVEAQVEWSSGQV